MALWSERHVLVDPPMYYRVLIGLAADYESPNREPICITEVLGIPRDQDFQVVVGVKIEYRENELPSTDNAIGFYVIVRKRIDTPDKSEIPETDNSVDDSPAWRPTDDKIVSQQSQAELEYPPSPPTFEQVANAGTSDSPPAQTFTQMAATMCNGSSWKGISLDGEAPATSQLSLHGGYRRGGSCPEGIQ